MLLLCGRSQRSLKRCCEEAFPLFLNRCGRSPLAGSMSSSSPGRMTGNSSDRIQVLRIAIVKSSELVEFAHGWYGKTQGAALYERPPTGV